GRPRDDVVADPSHVEPRRRAQGALHLVGDRALVAAHRGDRDIARREIQQVTHVATPWARRTSLSALKSWRSPGSNRRSTSTHGKKNSPPGNSRRLDAPTAT